MSIKITSTGPGDDEYTVAYAGPDDTTGTEERLYVQEATFAAFPGLEGRLGALGFHDEGMHAADELLRVFVRPLAQVRTDAQRIDDLEAEVQRLVALVTATAAPVAAPPPEPPTEKSADVEAPPEPARAEAVAPEPPTPDDGSGPAAPPAPAKAAAVATEPHAAPPAPEPAEPAAPTEETPPAPKSTGA